MSNQEKEKFIEFKRVDEIKFPKFNYLIVGIIIAIFAVGWYGFITINHQLSELAGKIEEVKIEETSVINHDEKLKEETTNENKDINSSEQVQVNKEKVDDENKSIIGFWNEMEDADSKTIEEIEKKVNKDKNVINCRDYTKLISVVVSLKQRLDFGESFQREIVLLSVAGKSDKNLAKLVNILDNYAESGVPNIDILVSEFKSIENDLILASRLSDEPSNWKQKIIKLVSKFIFIKKIGDRALRDGGIDMTVQKVNNFLAEEDLVQAVAELEKIENQNIKNIAAIWISHVNDYLNAQKVAKEVYRYVFNNLNCQYKEQKITIDNNQNN